MPFGNKALFGRTCETSIIALCASLLTANNALAVDTKVGVTSAVIPQFRGTRESGETRVLQIGVDVFVNERVTTGPTGKAQLLFLDGSALSVGPNSDVVLDEFVYDVDAGTGKLAFSATKGLFRLVGGKISKRTPVTLTAPNATIGIRGGIALAEVQDPQQGGEVQATFLFGAEMTVTSGEQTQRARRPGSRIAVPRGQPPQPPVPATSETLSNEVARLEASREEIDLASLPITDDDIATTQVATLGSDAPLDPPPQEVSDVAQDADDRSERVDASDLERTEATGGDGVTRTGFIGRAKRGVSTAIGTLDLDADNNVALGNVNIANNRLTALTDAGGFSLPFPSAPGTFDLSDLPGDITTPNGAVSGTVKLTENSDFVIYKLFGSRELIAAGVPTTTFPTSGVSAFAMDDDFARASDEPFIDDVDTDNHGQLFIQWDDSASGAQRAFGGGAVVINGQGTGQTAGATVFYGRVDDDPRGGKHIRGQQRGLARPNAGEQSRFFSSDVASVDLGGDPTTGGGTDFAGAGGPNYFVLDSTAVDTNDVPTGAGATRTFEEVDTTIFPNTVAFKTDAGSVGSSRTTQTFQGFAGGLVRSISGGATTGTAFLSNSAPANVSISTNASLNTVSASFALSGGGDTYGLFFGETTPSGNSAFIGDGVFTAGESNTSSTLNGTQVTDAGLGLITDHFVQTNDFLPAGVSFCSCEYVTWGFWGAEIEAVDVDDRHVDLATFVTGNDLADTTQVVGFTATASYTGHVIATVNNQGNVYQAIGRLNATFNFTNTLFDITAMSISDFDGTNFTANISSGGDFTTNLYNTRNFGVLVNFRGNHPDVGTVDVDLTGAFFGPGTPPEDTAGTAEFTGTNYKAGGTFAGSRTP